MYNTLEANENNSKYISFIWTFQNPLAEIYKTDESHDDSPWTIAQ